MTSEARQDQSNGVSEWRVLAQSAIGSSHLRENLPCQDMCAAAVLHDAQGHAVLALVASDGAGSACRAQEGARLVSDLFMEQARDHVAAGTGAGALTLSQATEWVRRIAKGIREHAESLNLVPRDLASTLVGIIADRSGLAGFQVGDGAIVLASGLEYRPLFWPERGQYANMTHFVSDEDATDHLQFAVEREVADEIAVLTDGLQSLALNYAAKSAHAPFFAPLFIPIRDAVSSEAVQSLAEPLAHFLSSASLERRTDDDKTLILATRRTPLQQASLVDAAQQLIKARSTDEAAPSSSPADQPSDRADGQASEATPPPAEAPLDPVGNVMEERPAQSS